MYCIVSDCQMNNTYNTALERHRRTAEPLKDIPNLFYNYRTQLTSHLKRYPTRSLTEF